jgi:hypothetical protein
MTPSQQYPLSAHPPEGISQATFKQSSLLILVNKSFKFSGNSPWKPVPNTQSITILLLKTKFSKSDIISIPSNLLNAFFESSVFGSPARRMIFAL